MSLGHVFSAVSLSAVIAASTPAQTLPPDSRVRVWSTAATFRNFDTRIIGARGDSLVVQDGPRSSVITIPRSSLTRLEIRTRKEGSVRKRVVRGAAVGAAAGALLGLAGAGLYIAQAERRGTCGDESGCYWSLYLAPPPGLILGGIGGAMVGRAQSFAWISIADPRRVKVEVRGRLP